MLRRPQILFTTVGAAVLLALTGCGSSSGSTGSSGSPTATAASSPVESSTAVLTSVGEDSTGSVAGSTPVATSASSAGPATSGSTASTSGTGGALAGCTPADLKTTTSGKLTIATSEPAYEPWMVDDDPTNGKGYESAVAYAVATRLGFAKADVTWTRISFNAAVSPAPKSFDFDINQFSITDTRKKAVDFSTGYYDVTQAIVTTKGSLIAKATTLAGLKGAHLGAQIGTTSLTALKSQIAPSANPTVYESNEAAVAGLKAGQVDGLVMDLPTAFYVSGAELDNGVLLGQLPLTGGRPEQFGLLLEKGSSLTDCASKAVDALRADGTLAQLTTQWLTSAGAPILK